MLKDESKFLNKIKDTCIEEAKKYDILPSVLASLAITISKWGMSKEFYKTKNIYMLPVPSNNTWWGKCYSKKLDKIYAKSSEAHDTDLYKVYDNYKDSISDFVSTLANARRSLNGPHKYKAIIGCLDYRKAISILSRAELFNELGKNKDQNDIQYTSTLISIIEKYDLYQWDSEIVESLSMSKKKHKSYQNDNNNEEQTTIVEETVTPVEHIYRVRLDWDRRDTQIFSSTSYEDCLAEAKKHEGYKIYIDDGELFENPWLNVNNLVNDVPERSGPKPTICVVAGQPITLHNTPIYKNSTDKGSIMKLSGVFYFYDNGIINGRAKIIKDKSLARTDLKHVVGYVDIK